MFSAVQELAIGTGNLPVLLGFGYGESEEHRVSPRIITFHHPTHDGHPVDQSGAPHGRKATPAGSDADLVRETLAGQNGAFDLLVDRHLSAAVGFFRYLRVPPNRLEDLVQETFLRAFRKLELYDATRSFSVWLLTIGRNLYFDERRRCSFSEVPIEHIERSTPSPEDEIIERHTARELLDSLPDESRLLLELRIYRDLSFPEIAELTGEAETTLRVRFHRLMLRLRLTVASGGEHENR
ncbi:MAG TPA: sigma-70 family RNA polymerase sigma factor [Candidatus Ozemobacteraceae bacterium]|nr:sigma-70 family RNA polymerase sigma factor [Candidatus Ozemobacteraceae bacterium]